jgi:effector-binding domain-containing protein
MITAPEILTTAEQPAATIHLVISGMEMARHMDPAIQEVLSLLAEQGMQPAGPMFSYHHRRPSDTFDFEIGFPVSGPVQEKGRVKNSALPAGRLVRAVHQGPYERLGDAWRALQDWVRAKELPETGRFYERYLNNPEEVEPKDYLTELNWVVG